MIRLANISKVYDGKYALRDISLNIKKGETLAVIGGFCFVKRNIF